MNVTIVSLDTMQSVLEDMGSWHQACAIGKAEMCYCIAHDDDGLWRVFWMERGNRIQEWEFADEQDACLEFMGRVAGRAKVVEWLGQHGRSDLADKVHPLL